jgi:hypothetical protein
MKARPKKSALESRQPETTPPECAISENGIDRALLEESLSKSVWERMLANDDALRLADMLQAAMVKTRAKS